MGRNAPAETQTNLLRNADAAMYMAKESGKNDYQVFQPEMHAQALARLELKTDLQRALEAGEFTLRYQPIVDLTRNEMTCMGRVPFAGSIPRAEWSHRSISSRWWRPQE